MDREPTENLLSLALLEGVVDGCFLNLVEGLREASAFDFRCSRFVGATLVA